MSAEPAGNDVTRWLRYAAIGVGVLLLATLAWGAWVWWSAERAIDRQSFQSLDDRDGGSGDGGGDELAPGVLNVLVVGSDSREGLTEEQRERLHTGMFEGEQTDTILLVQTTPDGQSILSFPRDLKVQVGTEPPAKINSILADHGRDVLIQTVELAVGVQIDHYMEVAIPSFLEIVDAVGGVDICLDEALLDEKSGADFTAGCHEMDGAEALSYVRSREGARSDYARVERQQNFLRALADEATSLSVLSNPLRLRDLVTSVSDGLTVDDGLSVRRMIDLATALRGRLSEGLDTTALPSYPAEENGIAYVIAYPPGVDEVAQALRTASPLPPRGSSDDLASVALGIMNDGAPEEASTIESVLYFAGYAPEVIGASPMEVSETTVFHAPGAEDEAEWVAGVLGATVEPWPTDLELRQGLEVVVVAAPRPEPTVGGVLAPPA